METTTIQIPVELKNKLMTLKDYARETYAEIIEKLLFLVAEENMELSQETKNEIEEARKEFKAGRFVTEEEMKARLKLE